MIDLLRLQSFKAHRDSEVPLGRLTVLVGPNGAGKISVLQALDLLHRALREPWSQVFTGESSWGQLRRKVVERGSPPSAKIHVSRKLLPHDPDDYLAVDIESRIDFEPGVPLYHPTNPGTEANQITWEHVGVEDMERGSLEVTAGRAAQTNPPLLDLAERLGSTLLLRPDPRKLAMPSHSGDVIPRLSTEGEGLAEVIAHMMLSAPDTTEELQKAYRAVIPQVQRFRVERTKVQKPSTRILHIEGKQVAVDEIQETIGYALVFDTIGGSGIPASAMSEGSLIALGILTSLLGPERPGLVLIDGLEHALHPRAQWEILAEIRKILEQYPDLQLVATTHSPDLVDKLEPSEVVVMALRQDGTVGVRPLTECPRKDMLDVLCAGELWSAMGEDWVVASDTEPSEGTPQ